MGQIDDLNKMDGENYEQVRNALGHARELPEDILTLYDRFYSAIEPLLKTTSDRMAAVIINGICRNHLMRGTTSLMRLYTAPAFRELRGAAEAAGIAYVIHTDPGAMEVFQADDGIDADARRKARNLFKPKTLFAAKIQPIQDLKGIYEISSRMAHTNLVTVLRQIQKLGTTGSAAVSVQDAGGRDQALRELPTILLWMCLSHVTVLETALVIFRHLPVDLMAFKKEEQYINDKLLRFRAVHIDRYPDIRLPVE